MATRSHRIEKIVYAKKGITFCVGDNLHSAISGHPETNDFSNYEGGGILETTVKALKEIHEKAKKKIIKLEESELADIEQEIYQLTEEGKEDYDYIQYDMF